MAIVEISTNLGGSLEVWTARSYGGPITIGVWFDCLLWSSANRNVPYGGERRPIWFLPREVAREKLGRARKVEQALVKSGMWEPVTWNGARGYKITGERYLWRTRKRTPRVHRRPLIPQHVRDAVYKRDGWACLHCGATERLSLDHIHPYSLGGSDEPENLQTLCVSCNSRKGARV